MTSKAITVRQAGRLTKTARRVFLWLALPLAGALIAAQPWTQWNDYAGSADSMQYSALSQINKKNVKQLELAWSVMAPGPAGRFSFNPLVIDRTMYVVGKDSAIYALDATSGRQIWMHAVEGHPTNRGFNYWESKDRKDQRLIFVSDGYLQELNLKTGAAISSFGNRGRVNLGEGLGRDPKTIGEIQSGSPGRVFENLIILGSAAVERYGSAPGDLRAYDVQTGKIIWTFHTVPRPGEFGYDTWPPEAWKYAGGVNTWSDFSVDEKRGIAYFPLGSPTYDLYGADRTGANLFGNCLLALDVRTGKRLWHFQLVHHDLWDYDAAVAPKLLTIRHDGNNIDVVVQPSKSGFLYVFDRVTGKPVWPIEERRVPQSDMPGEHSWPTQPFPVAPPPFARQQFGVADINPHVDAEEKARLRKIIGNASNQGIFTPPAFNRDQIAVPGEMGGANWGSTAADPASGMLYVRAYDAPTIHKLTEAPTVQEINGGTPEQIGYALYMQSCVACHGPNRERITYPEKIGMNGLIAVLRSGKGEMPSFSEKTLPPAQVTAIAAYLKNPAAGAGPGTKADATQQKRFYGLFGNVFLANNALLAFKPPWSSIVAYDLNSGTIKWRRPIGTTPGLAAKGIKDTGSSALIRNGPVVTAGGLIFIGTSSDRMVHAIDKDTGKTLWEIEIDANPDGIPAVYEVAGREYIAFFAAGLSWRDYLLSQYHDARQYIVTRGKEIRTWKQAKPGSQGYYVFALPKR